MTDLEIEHLRHELSLLYAIATRLQAMINAAESKTPRAAESKTPRDHVFADRVESEFHKR